MEIRVGSKPSVLDKVYVTDFADNYHRTDMDPTTELERKVRRIRRRYKHISDYVEAAQAYNEYMGLLILRHGGPALFKLKMKDEAIDDFIPPRPRMKNTPTNKFMIKNGIIISQVKPKQINEDVIAELEEVYMQDTPSEIMMTEDDVSKDIKKIAKESDFTRIKTKDLRDIDSIDHLEAFFRSKNLKVKDKVNEEWSKLSLTDLIEGKHGLIKDTTEQDDIILHRGRYMNREAVEELQVYQQLAQSGWDALKLMREQKVGKKVRSIIKDTEKERKRKKKKKKAYGATDNFLVNLAGDNGYDSFGDFERDLLNMRSEDIFN